MKKRFCLLLILIFTVSTLMLVNLVSASVPKPSAPEFTAKAVANAIEITVKNQPLPSYENGSHPSLYYMFRFGDRNTSIGFWHYDPVYFVLPSTYGGYHKASDSEFTIISLSLEGHHFPSGQIGIHAIALVGNQYPTDKQNGTVYGFEGETSSWSNIQTIAIPGPSVPSPSPKPASFSPDLSLMIVSVAVSVAVVCIVSLVYCKKRRGEAKP